MGMIHQLGVPEAATSQEEAADPSRSSGGAAEEEHAKGQSAACYQGNDDIVEEIVRFTMMFLDANLSQLRIALFAFICVLILFFSVDYRCYVCCVFRV